MQGCEDKHTPYVTAQEVESKGPTYKRPLFIGQKSPMVQQADAAECGFACLTMVTNCHGHKTDSNASRRCSPAPNGHNLRGIIIMAENLKWHPCVVKLEMEGLWGLPLCIMQRNLNHFVVLKRVVANNFTIDMFAAFLAYKLQFIGSVSNLVNKWIKFKMLRLHLERITDIELAEPKVEETELTDLTMAPLNPEEFNGKLKLDNIHVKYADAEPDVISGTRIEINHGESVAIVGPFGCGKTTLMKIAMGLLEPTRSTIKVDDNNISQTGKKNNRKQIAGVMQDDVVLSGTLADNISFLIPSQTSKALESASGRRPFSKEFS